MSKETPAWLPEAREFCRNAGIEVSGWGSDTLLVKVESPDRTNRLVSQLRPLGFEPIEDEDDAEAGLLLLSRNPAATRARQTESWTNVDVSQRPTIERAAPVLEGSLFIWCCWYSIAKAEPKSWFYAALASILLIVFLRDVSRFWGWKLQVSPEELRVRRNFRWSAIPWTQIQAAETGSAGGRNQEAVTLTLTSNARLRLGTFGYRFARVLRDRLRKEINQRRREPNGNDCESH
jgi:membrane protein YdbS with pleckstrin-like domain